MHGHVVRSESRMHHPPPEAIAEASTRVKKYFRTNTVRTAATSGQIRITIRKLATSFIRPSEALMRAAVSSAA